LLYRPWSILSHQFLHVSLGHIFWNMMSFYLFGRITGDLLGDRKILPLYLFGGIISAITFMIAAHFIYKDQAASAIGASGAIMAIAVTAAMIAPDYIVRLILLGDVKIKYIVFAFIFFDLIASQGMVNTGGAYGHLGGALAGFMYIYLYKKGINLLKPIEYIINLFTRDRKEIYNERRAKMRVEYRNDARSNAANKGSSSLSLSHQEQLDLILDKIRESGYEKLTSKEKEFLKEASKK
ncbi:MAG: hypothetical protein RLZZ546_3294, partial [Bacteroidota bacterium]